MTRTVKTGLTVPQMEPNGHHLNMVGVSGESILELD